MNRSAFLIFFFALNVNANECERALRVNEARAQIMEAQHTAELLGLCLRQSAQQIDNILEELNTAASLNLEQAQSLLQRAEDACRLQVRAAPKRSTSLNIRARETLHFEFWDQL